MIIIIISDNCRLRTFSIFYLPVSIFYLITYQMFLYDIHSTSFILDFKVFYST